MQAMLRMIGYGENLGSGFPLILTAWNEQHWLRPELTEQPELMQVKLTLHIENHAKVSEEQVKLAGQVGDTNPLSKKEDNSQETNKIGKQPESVTPQVTPQVKLDGKLVTRILEFCGKPKTKLEIMAFLDYSDRKNFREKYLKPLLDQDLLRMTIPDKPRSKNQRYVAHLSQSQM